MFLSDGPYGLRKQEGTSDHLGLNPSLPATCYPTVATIANSWDIELAEQIVEYIEKEAVAQGVSVVLGPGLNMKRSPLCGRNFEYFSEDPYLAGKLASAYIKGIQSKGVAACPKHLAVNSQERLRLHNDSVLDERTLQEIYLTAFEIAVKEGKPLFIMTSYNKINDAYANEDQHLLQDLLVNEWGFSGLIFTDWGGSNDRVAGLIAGNQLEMPATKGQSDMEVAKAVQNGSIFETLIDQSVDNYLKVLYATQIPEKQPSLEKEKNHCFAKKATEESIVLLKNDENILPLKPKTKVAIIGDFAQTPRYQGSGSSLVNATKVDIPLDCWLESDMEVVGYQPGFLRHGGEDKARLESALHLAELSDVVLLYLGLDEIREIEGIDRSDMKINENQVVLLEALSQVNPNIVVVLCGGGAVETPWLGECKAPNQRISQWAGWCRSHGECHMRKSESIWQT